MNREELKRHWRERLLAEIERQGKSQRAVSVAAKLNPGTLNTWLKNGKDPSIDHLIAVCAVLNISIPYLLYGTAIDPKTEQLLLRLQGDPEARDHILALLESRSNGSRPEATKSP